MGEVKQWLDSCVSVKDILSGPSRILYSVPGTTLLLEALEFMSQHRLTAIPVSSASGDVLGFVDNVDILKHFCKGLDIVEKLDSWRASDLESPAVNVPISSLLGRNPTIEIEETAKAGELLRFFVEKNVHRALVKNSSVSEIKEASKDNLVVCSQSDVIRFLASKLASKSESVLNACSEVVIDEKIPEKDLVTIPESSTLLEVVSLMGKKNVSCLGITDSSGVLIGEFAASDLRGIGHIDAALLNKRSIDFIREKSASSDPAILFQGAASVSAVLQMLANLRVHRVWIVNSERKPVKIITLTDALKSLSTM
jgi:CBS domain-containing protein